MNALFLRTLQVRLWVLWLIGLSLLGSGFAWMWSVGSVSYVNRGESEGSLLRYPILGFRWIWKEFWNVIWYQPLWHVYLFYVYEGSETPDICARLTHVPASFWGGHSEECYQLITTRYYSFIYVFQALFVWVLLGYLFYRWIQRWTHVPSQSIIVYLPSNSAKSALGHPGP